MSDVLIGWLFGMGGGFGFGFSYAIKRCLKTPPDVLAEGVRKQMENVKMQKKFVDDEWQVSSYATLTSNDVDYEIIVRQPVTGCPSSPSTF